MKHPWNGQATPMRLGDHHFTRAASAIGCEAAVIKAVFEVEAGAKFFLDDGTVIRRFEPHHFPSKYWGGIGFSVRKGEQPWRASLRQSSEAMFQKAYAAAPTAAISASSWGAPQIMAGMNHQAAGFDSPVAMVEAMAAGADRQLDAFVSLVLDWGLDGAIRAHDWQAFENRYNGGGQGGAYARKIEAAYRRKTGEASPEVLRLGSRGAAVRRLQAALGATVDGRFGPATEGAVRAFQERVDLPVDGLVGARTWDALKQSRDAKPKRRAAVKESTTVQAASVQVAAAVGGMFEALRSLDGTAQVVALGVVGLVLVSAIWIARERIRRILAGLG